jgi:hypothetical protein
MITDNRTCQNSRQKQNMLTRTANTSQQIATILIEPSFKKQGSNVKAPLYAEILTKITRTGK